jgi:hypothetical protein
MKDTSETSTDSALGGGSAREHYPRGQWVAWRHDDDRTGRTSDLPIQRFGDRSPAVERRVARGCHCAHDHARRTPRGEQRVEGVLAYRTNLNQLALYTKKFVGGQTWTNLSCPRTVLPTPSADPIPFFDPSGNVDLLYIDTDAHVILLSQNDPMTSAWHHLRSDSAWRPYVATDLSALSGVNAANGLPSILVNGLTALVAYRSVTEHHRDRPTRLGPGSSRSVHDQYAGSVTVDGAAADAHDDDDEARDDHDETGDHDHETNDDDHRSR